MFSSPASALLLPINRPRQNVHTSKIQMTLQCSLQLHLGRVICPSRWMDGVDWCGMLQDASIMIKLRHPAGHFTANIVCQMLSWWTKSSLHSINIQDTFTNVLLLCSVCQAPCYEHNLTMLVPFPTELAYLSIIFILEVVCTACSADHLKNRWHAQITNLWQEPC